MCDSEPGKLRRFCFQDLSSYYDKVSFLHGQNLNLNVLVYNII